jgi:beta-glucosidase
VRRHSNVTGIDTVQALQETPPESALPRITPPTPGYAGSSYLDPGGPGAGDSAKILAYLRQNLGYTGLITTDWLPSGAWINAANAGSDVMGGADPGATGFTMASFESGVPTARINDAVTRILRLKFELGIFDHPYGDPVNGPYRFHQPGYTALANQAARESDTLLKNNGVLPIRLTSGDNIVVAGPRATDGAACCIRSSYFHDAAQTHRDERLEQPGRRHCGDLSRR